jgi:hypothetical protein
MKKIIFALVLTTIIMASYGQDIKIGLRFKPLNSNYQTYESMSFNQGQTSSDKYKSRFDSLTIGIFFEKYFAKKGFLIRADINYANLHTGGTENSVNTDQSFSSSEDYTESFKQKYVNINLGIGTHVDWKVITFTVGAYVPFTILPKGEYTRDDTYYQDYVKSSNSTGTAKYKAAMGIGIGAFGGVSTTILKHLSLGLDVTYQIEYLSRKLTWHSETNNYGTNPYMTYTDEKQKIRNYFTSKLVPSIVIAYAFDCKKKEVK